MIRIVFPTLRHDLLWRRTQTQSARFGGHDCSAGQFAPVSFKRTKTNCGVLGNRKIHDPDYAAMRAAKGNSKFAEILVESDNDPAITQSGIPDFVI